jgi:putative flippase GtrA
VPDSTDGARDESKTNRWQPAKFLVAGAFNTALSLVVFGGLYLLLQDSLHYTIIATLAYIISITNSFIVYKYLVFRSTGNILKEYFRSYLVYGVSFLVSMTMLVLLVEITGIHPIIAQCLTIVVVVFVSYFGSSKFTFRQET